MLTFEYDCMIGAVEEDGIYRAPLYVGVEDCLPFVAECQADCVAKVSGVFDGWKWWVEFSWIGYVDGVDAHYARVHYEAVVSCK